MNCNISTKVVTGMNLERNFEMYRLKLGKLYGKLSFFPESLSSTKSSNKKDKNGDLKKNILKLQEYMKNYNELKEKENEITNKKNEESENLKKENLQLDSMNKNPVNKDILKQQEKQVYKLKKQIESFEQQAKKLNDKAEKIKKKISDLLVKMSDYDYGDLKSIIEGIKNSIGNKTLSEEGIQNLNKSQYSEMKQQFEDLKKRKKMVTDVDKCMKRISNDLKELKRYRSWFFKKDNVAKTAYKFSFDLYRSIKKDLKQNDNLDDLFSVYDKLIMALNYIRDAIKARVLEKKLHNNESDFTRNVLKSLYDNFSNLCTIIFNKNFTEISYDFESLNVYQNKTIEYYKKLIKLDLKKLYKKTSGIFRKDNAAKILYICLSKFDIDNLGWECKSDIKNDAIINVKNGIESRRKEIIDRAESKKREVIDNDFRNDETLVIMYHLLEDFVNVGKSLKIDVDLDDFDEGLKIDEQTVKNYQVGIDVKIAELSKPQEQIKDEIEKLKGNIKDKIEKSKENLKNQISKFLNIHYTSYMRTYYLDLSKNQTVSSKCQEFTTSVGKLKFDDFLKDEKAHENFKLWGENFSKDLDTFVVDLKKIAADKFKNLYPTYKYEDYNIDRNISDIQSDITKIVSETSGYLENNSKNILLKTNECKEYSEKINKYKKDSEKIFKKDSKGNLRLRAVKGAKILGDVVTSFFIPGANVGRVVVTLEGVKLAKKIAGTSGVDKSSIVILVSETDIDCKLFKVASSSPAKLRVYLTLSSPLLLNMLSKVPDSTRIVDCIGNLDVQNNFRSGKIYFHPYGGHSEKYEGEKEDPYIRYDKKKMDLKEQKDYGKSKQIMKEIKAKIAELKPSIFGKVFKSDVTKSVYEPINHIYKNFRKSLKSASADDVESKEFLRAAKSFIFKMLEFPPENEEDQKKHGEKYKKMNQYLAELFGKLVDLEKYMFGYESELKNEKELKEFMSSQDRAKIFGEILAASDLLGMGALIFTIENATLKGLMSAGNEHFMPRRNSYVACVADLNIKMTLDSYLAKKEDESYGKSFAKNILAFVGTSGVTANVISGGAKILGLSEKSGMIDTFASFLSILGKGIRIRTYVSVDNFTFATKMVNITTKLQKGKIKLIK